MTRLSPTARGYDGAWRRARAEHLRLHPWCAMCAREGRQVRAVHVHHSIPHKGNRAVFNDRSRWVSLCTEHHNRDAQQVETRGYASRIGSDGLPSDPRHPFNRPEGGGSKVQCDRGPRPHGEISSQLISGAR
ncbi:hypothetical protein EV668_3609 [Enterovirga rhinocerotis]|uniref:HNH endonuclease n=1 Tax=Enterovirga rhinocerotis TaxID=1339210 RepID=A0A4R7BUE3_9HYPH|nr:hypothetical protein EV668_3609 [Enterovirga rhinocerotis]